MKPLLVVTPKVRGMLVASALMVFAGSSLYAAPSLDVRKPPVVSGVNPNTGPAAVDPLAKRGQWFRNVATGAVFVLNNEFHDNATGQGGGVFGTKAIFGVVGSIVYLAGPGTNIIGFSVNARVLNDTNSISGPWQPGGNSHGERSVVSTSYVGPLFRPVLVTEFALTSTALFPVGPIAGTPYTLSPGPRIIAVNHDVAGWYCFNNTVVAGNYYVPGWQLPTVPVGGAVGAVLQFRVIDGGLTPADPRYAVVVNSLAMGLDILSNRSTSLKISNWVDRLWTDNGAPYFTFSFSSDAGVFHLTPDVL